MAFRVCYSLQFIYLSSEKQPHRCAIDYKGIRRGVALSNFHFLHLLFLYFNTILYVLCVVIVKTKKFMYTVNLIITFYQMRSNAHFIIYKETQTMCISSDLNIHVFVGVASCLDILCSGI